MLVLLLFNLTNWLLSVLNVGVPKITDCVQKRERYEHS